MARARCRCIDCRNASLGEWQGVPTCRFDRRGGSAFGSAADAHSRRWKEAAMVGAKRVRVGATHAVSPVAAAFHCRRKNLPADLLRSPRR
jgi:hypothetical protein